MTPPLDDEHERRARLLLLDESSTPRRPRRCRVTIGREKRSSRPEDVNLDRGSAPRLARRLARLRDVATSVVTG
jgi:hypothetical protein